MYAKQVNIAVPMKLYEEVEQYVKENGYRNAQDLFLDLARQRVIFDKEEFREDFVENMLDLKNKKKIPFSSIKEFDRLVDNA